MKKATLALIGLVLTGLIAGYVFSNKLPKPIQEKFHIGMYGELQCNSDMAQYLLRKFYLDREIEKIKKGEFILYSYALDKKKLTGEDISPGEILIIGAILSDPHTSSMFIEKKLAKMNATKIEETPIYKDIIAPSIEALQEIFKFSILKSKQYAKEGDAVYCQADIVHYLEDENGTKKDEQHIRNLKYKLELTDPKTANFRLTVLEEPKEKK